MAEARRWPPFAVFYASVFLLALIALPVVVVGLKREALFVPPTVALSVTVLTLWLFLLWHVQRRCSSERLSYWRGLVAIAAWMSTGWPILSILFALPVLLVVFLGSLVITLESDISRTPGRAAPRFQQLVARVYGFRMRQ